MQKLGFTKEILQKRSIGFLMTENYIYLILLRALQTAIVNPKCSEALQIAIKKDIFLILQKIWY